ncbi:hypothetical protein K458DRAFT_399919 [Lentithecium fluviatile CBS 122367]|uniref:Uncharacterized protein n=1 Tax=Lentithecium fluviatile CBS 122367 TaxID=1168545 RepID=A0A6G1JEW8_9PLEO|nr:hypothetical protein K458DRAFT_399919 [Lentithecium fluviatile CBS 122367]
MDPLSISASVVAVIEAASGIIKVLDKLWELRHTSLEVVLVRNEITDLCALLDILRDVLTKLSCGVALSIQTAISTLHASVHKVANYISTLERLIIYCLGHPECFLGSKALYVRWARKKKQVLRLQQQIPLQEAIVLNGTKGTGIHTQNIILTTDNFLHEFTKRSHLGKSDSEKDSTVALPRGEEVETGAVIPYRQTQPFGQPLGDKDFVQIRAYPGKDTCSRNCPCQCHVRTKIESPRWLQGLIGTIFCGYNGSPLLEMRPCDYSKCRRCEPTSLSLTYIFPAWFLARALSVTMFWNSFAAPAASMTVHVSNVIPLSSPIFGNIITGSHSGVTDIFSQRLASPFDVDPSGRSLLHWAMDQIQPNISQLLIQSGADPFIVDSTGRFVNPVFSFVQSFFWTNDEQERPSTYVGRGSS